MAKHHSEAMPKTDQQPDRKGLLTPVGVPRRFGLSHLMLFTLLLALLLGLLSWGGVDPASSMVFAVFFLVVGASQAILFDGKRPRMASIFSGGVLAPILVLVATAVFPDDDSWLFIESKFFVIAGSPLLFISGVPLGYVFGGLIAGIFLIKDRGLDEVESIAPPLKEEARTEAPEPEMAAEAELK